VCVCARAWLRACVRVCELAMFVYVLYFVYCLRLYHRQLQTNMIGYMEYGYHRNFLFHTEFMQYLTYHHIKMISSPLTCICSIYN